MIAIVAVKFIMRVKSFNGRVTIIKARKTEEKYEFIVSPTVIII